jgi:hypothetical protein
MVSSTMRGLFPTTTVASRETVSRAVTEDLEAVGGAESTEEEVGLPSAALGAAASLSDISAAARMVSPATDKSVAGP